MHLLFDCRRKWYHLPGNLVAGLCTIHDKLLRVRHLELQGKIDRFLRAQGHIPAHATVLSYNILVRFGITSTVPQRNNARRNADRICYSLFADTVLLCARLGHRPLQARRLSDRRRGKRRIKQLDFDPFIVRNWDYVDNFEVLNGGRFRVGDSDSLHVGLRRGFLVEPRHAVVYLLSVVRHAKGRIQAI